jgi:hypothetical protein
VTLRCDCSDDEKVHVDGGQRDPYVFGPCITCSKAAQPAPRPLPPLVPSWRFVVPTGEQVLRDPYDLDDDERRGY